MAQGTRANSKGGNGNGTALGFEATLWATADKLRGNLDAAEYKHVVLGLIFLKYISDAFEERHAAVRDALLPKLLSGEVRVPNPH
jgi:type I restriction enzyme M protein